VGIALISAVLVVQSGTGGVGGIAHLAHLIGFAIGLAFGKRNESLARSAGGPGGMQMGGARGPGGPEGPGGPGGRLNGAPADLPQGHPDNIERPELLPDPSLSRAEMESLQRELAATATFADDHGIDPAVVAIDEPADLTDGLPDAPRDAAGHAPEHRRSRRAGRRGIDQAFLTPDDGEDRAVSAAVAIRRRRRDRVRERHHATLDPLHPGPPRVPGRRTDTGRARRPRRRAGSAGL